MAKYKFTEIDNLEFLKDDDVIEITRKELVNFTKGKCCDVVAVFINLCETMAGENWCNSQVEMLERLFEKVLNCKPYAEQPEENE